MWKTEALRIWVFPKIMVPPNHPFLIGFSIINLHFGVPLFLETSIWILAKRKENGVFGGVNVFPSENKSLCSVDVEKRSMRFWSQDKIKPRKLK